MNQSGRGVSDEFETGLEPRSFSSPELHFRSKSEPVARPRIESGQTGDYSVSKVVTYVTIVHFHSGERVVRVTPPLKNQTLRTVRFCVTLESTGHSI